MVSKHIYGKKRFLTFRIYQFTRFLYYINLVRIHVDRIELHIQTVPGADPAGAQDKRVIDHNLWNVLFPPSPISSQIFS